MKPNIILIYTDQQRYDTIGAAGNDIIQTPALDALSNHASLFNRCYTASPVCVSGRCSLLYGQYPAGTKCYDNSYPMPDCQPSIMDTLKDDGYYTQGIGKMHFTPDSGALRGFNLRISQEELPEKIKDDDYLMYLDKHKQLKNIYDIHGQRSELFYIPQISQLQKQYHPTQFIGDMTEEFIENYDKDRPFFLMSSYIHPHPPFAPCVPWNKLYRAVDMPLPKVPVDSENIITNYNRIQNQYKYKDWGIDKNLERTQKAFYYACISFVDYQISRTIDALKKRGIYDNTMIIFTSDHGELLGDYDCFGKRSMVDSACRVPLIIKYPNSINKNVITDAVSTIDVYKTIIDIADIKTNSATLDGISLAGENYKNRDCVFSHIGCGEKALYMAASKNEKYYYSVWDEKNYYFNLKDDPNETQNQAYNDIYKHKVIVMKKKIIKYLKSNNSSNVEDDDFVKFKSSAAIDKLKKIGQGGFQDQIWPEDNEWQFPEGYNRKK